MINGAVVQRSNKNSQAKYIVKLKTLQFHSVFREIDNACHNEAYIPTSVILHELLLT